MFCRKRIDQKGVALFIVLASMATLSIFVGEITYTAQINQKLAYDRLDQVKAQALAKSGLRLALLRIKAYTELRKTVSSIAESAGASASAVNSVVPKAMIEKVWSEPVTIPFSGDLSALPGEMKDAIQKFRKDSGMEGKLYISIQAQSNKFNLNSILPQFAATPAPPAPKKGAPPPQPVTPAEGDKKPIAYDIDQARQSLSQQLKDSFQKKSESDEHFREDYRNFRIEDLVEEILGWGDLSYDSPREQVSTLPFKRAPFYHISELNYLPSMDDTIYEMFSQQFTAGIASYINVNTILEPVLKALVPQMTQEEVGKFFEFRDGKGEIGAEDNKFKSSDDFFGYLKGKVQYFMGSETRITDLKNALIQRGVLISTEESHFLVHIEATVQQTKKTLEAMVSLLESPSTGAQKPGLPAPGQPNFTGSPGQSTQNPSEKSNIKITQLRFL